MRRVLLGKRLIIGKVKRVELSAFCPRYHHAVEIVGRRWNGAIVRAMLAGAIRFTDITAVVPGLSDRLCSERLKELEAEGLVTRTVIPQTPVRIEYHLTDKGADLAGAVTALSRWAEEWIPDPRLAEHPGDDAAAPSSSR